MPKTYEVQPDMIQILNEDGEVDNDLFLKLNIDNELLLTMYEWILKGRVFDKKFINLQRQGRIGTYGSFAGQEAAQVGSALAIKKQDWIIPSYRETVVSLIHGVPLNNFLMYFRGHFGGTRPPKNVNMFPIQHIIAGQIPQAVGCSWASKLKGEDSVSTCYFGDGATSQGDFHEGLNFASVYKLPVVFFCQNNQWAISVPIEKQMGSETIAQKARAYGMKGVRVDGNDVLACYQVATEAMERARSGNGPTLIEAVTYRLGSHTTADDWTRYRSKEEVELWANKKDPLIRFESFLKQQGLFSSERKAEIVSMVEEEIETALAEFETVKPAPAYESFDFAYDKSHEDLLIQKEELKRRIKSEGR
ncbi:pyruvate dehydrogenase (acetyl-transferring) E1 component subunit alpha [Neobacillus niacini]|uniref:pyruvate dehydrogenase (acetyl-transferring) E1 component subunit alpha n=1 Tax=Neobacillus niacini TaxID=86668 RepID=UPI002FFFF144